MKWPHFRTVILRGFTGGKGPRVESRVELFAAIRHGAPVSGLSIRQLSEKYHVHRRTVRQALGSAIPPARVDRRSAEVILAEIGPDMSVFPTPGHLASWAGIPVP